MPIDADNLQTLLADHQLFHSDFQMDYLITVRAGGTPYGCYKQALRELSKRYRGLKTLYADRELTRIDLAELEEQREVAGTIGSRHDVRRKNVQIGQKRMALEEIERTIADTEREFRRFYGQAAALKEQLGDLTDERRGQLDREMWVHRLKGMVAVDMLSRGMPSPNTVEFIMACPPEFRTALIQEMNDPKPLLAWFYKHDAQLPAAKQIEGPVNLERLLTNG